MTLPRLCAASEGSQWKIQLKTILILSIILSILEGGQCIQDPAIYGQWETVVPNSDGAADGSSLGMQTVHSVLLPSGKILLASGSSWRNYNSTDHPLQYYPVYSNPQSGQGIFSLYGDPFNVEKLSEYYDLVNNVGIYDPEANTFYRIPHPVPVNDPNNSTLFAPTDLFCTGHMHLPDGNVLFTGGTQYYYPYRTGHSSSFVFDWVKELGIDWVDFDWRFIPKNAEDPWCFSGFMTRGRWYATLVPLLDRRMAVFSGFVGFDYGFPEMYIFELNNYVEFFDPDVFDPTNPQLAWKTVDVKTLPNSPYTTLINPDFQTQNNGCLPYDYCMEAMKYDAFKLYPENYLMEDGRIYLTREGDWVSLRTSTNEFMRLTNHTYWMSIEGTRSAPSVSFEYGPERLINVTSYGTTYRDPNTNTITLLGGQPTSNGTVLSLSPSISTIFAGGLGSTHREEFQPLASDPAGGRWTIDEGFLQDNLTMHYAIILPTRQILIINGGNYDFFGSVFNPMLLTPNFNDSGEFTGYNKTIMNPASDPRLYHNGAVLLPDGRVFSSGGNSGRATVSFAANTSSSTTGQPKEGFTDVNINMYFFGDGPMGLAATGDINVSTETWIAEIFSPPYLFIDPSRQVTIQSISASSSQPSGYVLSKTISNKIFYLIHSLSTYTVQLQSLPSSCPSSSNYPTLSLTKLPSVTHGWVGNQIFYLLNMTVLNATFIEFTTPNSTQANLPPGFYMLFYVDCKGKPSVSQMVRFDDDVLTPFSDQTLDTCRKFTPPSAGNSSTSTSTSGTSSTTGFTSTSSSSTSTSTSSTTEGSTTGLNTASTTESQVWFITAVIVFAIFF